MEQRDWVFSINLEGSDEEVGKELLAFRISAEATNRGLNLDQVSESLAKAWAENIAKQEARDSDVRNIPLEKALRSAAAGEWEQAGRIFRAFIRTLAADIQDRAKHIKGPKAGGRKRAQQQREKSAERNVRIIAKREKLLKAGTSPCELAGKLSIQFALDPSTIRKILKKAGVS